MNTLAAYIPPDRLRALVHGRSMPDRVEGAALFVDISGFTAVAFFLRFTGIDYDSETARDTLEAFIRWAQQVIARYDGTLLQSLSLQPAGHDQC